MSSPIQPLLGTTSLALFQSNIASIQDPINPSQNVLTGLEHDLSHLSIGKRTSDENPFQLLENEVPHKRQKTIHLAEGDRCIESVSRNARKQRQALRLQAMRREHSLRAPTYKLLETHGNSINSSRSAVCFLSLPFLYSSFFQINSRLDTKGHSRHDLVNKPL